MYYKLHFLERIWKGINMYGMTISDMECFYKILMFEIFTSGPEMLFISVFKFDFFRWISEIKEHKYLKLTEIQYINCTLIQDWLLPVFRSSPEVVQKHRKFELPSWFFRSLTTTCILCFHWCHKILTIPVVKPLTSGSFQITLYLCNF
jgi:hypothetical protein